MSLLDQSNPSCPVCKQTSPAFRADGSGRRVFQVTCSICGRYKVTFEAADGLQGCIPEDKRHLLSGVLRNASARGAELEVTRRNAKELADLAPIAHTPLGALDNLLLLISSRMQSFSDWAKIQPTDFSLLYLRSKSELQELGNHLKEAGYIHAGAIGVGDWSAKVTMAGWRRIEELERQRVRSQNAFVAMSFDPSLNDVWTDGIAPALEATGFAPIRVDRLEYNEKIDDRIIAEIRCSGLMIADFTGHRGGVYFEAGFALGLGIPVIWTCRNDQIDGAHFDTRQYNHIKWAGASDLRDGLIARIRATIPGAGLDA